MQKFINFVLIIVFSLTVLNLKSQDLVKIDSIKTLLKKETNDSAKINHYHSLYKLYGYFHPKSFFVHSWIYY